VFVRLGQGVRAGEPLGEVGHTGFSCGAHLHFQLQRTKQAVWAGQSVPARFRAIGDPAADEEIVSANCPVGRAQRPLQTVAR
jgi:murein DD-endopeptidase MepM/ murein hydrolase activator NlpD